MRVNMNGKGFWTLMLVGILVPVFLSGCVPPPSQGGIQQLEWENEEFRREIAKLQEQITELQKQMANLQTENQFLKQKLRSVGVAPLKVGEVAVGKVLTIDRKWKFTLDSYQILEDKSIRFNFLIENMQDKVADIMFGTEPGRTYLLDDRTNKYWAFDGLPIEWRTFIPHEPAEGYLIFRELEEGVKTVYLNCYCWIQRDWGYYSHELGFGPIELRE